MAGIPASQAEFQSDVDEIVPAIEKVQGKVEECQVKVRDVDWPSGWERLGQALLTAVFPIAGFVFAWKDIERLIADQPAVQALLDQAAQGAADIAAEVAQLMSPGNPFALKGMANEWDNIYTILSGVAGSISGDKFYATETWKDGMGVYYAKVPDGQSAALQGMLPHIENMRSYLREHADEILRLWADLCEEIADFVIEAVPLASKFISANPLKWVDMAQPIADCIAHVLTTVKDIVRLIFDFGMTSNSNLEQFRANASNVEGTDFGKWPIARLS